MPITKEQPLIGVVGPCAAGKTTLIAQLDALGYRTRHIAQEHSFVKDMWQRLSNPDVLIYLDASYPVSLKRRNLNWSQSEHSEQERRLRHAREHAELFIQTDDLTPEDVLNTVQNFMKDFI